MRGGGEYIPPDILRRNALVANAALLAGFHAEVVPGEAGYLVLSRIGEPVPVHLDAETLARRFRERGISTPGMTADHFHLLLPEGEAERAREALERAMAEEDGVNSDRSPEAFFQTFLLRAAESGWPEALLPGPAASWIVAAMSSTRVTR